MSQVVIWILIMVFITIFSYIFFWINKNDSLDHEFFITRELKQKTWIIQKQSQFRQNDK